MIDCWNRNDCKGAFLNVKNCTSTAERQDSTREFCVALWYHEHPERADDDMIYGIMPYLTNCAYICADEHDFEVIANGMRNTYYDGQSQGFSDGEDQWRSMGYTEGYENGYAEGWEEARDGE